jgi:hypothetical protein
MSDVWQEIVRRTKRADKPMAVWVPAYDTIHPIDPPTPSEQEWIDHLEWIHQEIREVYGGGYTGTPEAPVKPEPE